MMQLNVLLLCLVAASIGHASGEAGPGRVAPTPAGISQWVETRAGRIACWGVVIRLTDSRFKDAIGRDQIRIRETKYKADLREIMSWRVDQKGKRLVIQFKPGRGDFGTGNRVEVQVDRSAFADGPNSKDNRFEWSISTDVPLNGGTGAAGGSAKSIACGG